MIRIRQNVVYARHELRSTKNVFCYPLPLKFVFKSLYRLRWDTIRDRRRISPSVRLKT